MFQRRLRGIDECQIGFHLCHQCPHFLYVIALCLSIIGASVRKLTDLRIFRGVGGAACELAACEDEFGVC